MPAASTTYLPHSVHPSCRVVLDSTACLPREALERLAVDVLQFPYTVDGTEQRDDQWQSTPASAFYKQMRQGARCMTSALPLGELLELFESFAREAIPTVYVALPSVLSCTYNNAVQAAAMVKEQHPDFVLEIVDSCTPSFCAGLLAEQACAQRDAGASAQDVAAWIRANSQRVHGHFTLDSLTWLSQGGRIPKAAASLSSVLDMKANLSFDNDGKLTVSGVSRGRKKAIKALAATFTAHGLPALPVVGIADADCPQDADLVEKIIREDYARLRDTSSADGTGEDAGQQELQVLRFTVDPTVGVHVGPGMLGVSFWGDYPRP